MRIDFLLELASCGHLRYSNFHTVDFHLVYLQCITAIDGLTKDTGVALVVTSRNG